MGHLRMRQKIQARKAITPTTDGFEDEENEESGKPDLHQCGNCREMFYNFAKYITHKLQKVCWNADNTAPPPTTAANDEENQPQHWTNAADDNNGLSSPGEKEDQEDVDMTANIEVKPLHSDLQKRKHRKGIVRRIRPVEEAILVEPISTDPIVYVPADEDTVYVQAENVEERGNEDIPPEVQDKDRTEVISPRSAPYKYRVSLYNYSKAKSKHNKDDRDELNETKFSNKDIDLRLHLNPGQQEYARASYPTKYYHEAPQQHHYAAESSHSNNRYQPGHNESFSPRYKKTKYFEEQPPLSFYPHHSTSLRNSKTPMYSRQSDKFKTDTYIHHDKYRTMASLPADNQKQQQPFNSKTKNKENDTGYNLEKGLVNNKNIEKLQKSVNNTNKINLNPFSEQPPQLVHVSETTTPTNQQEDVENTSTFDKSPPALEKRESSFAEDDSIKVENDEESQDSVNGTGPVKYNANQLPDQKAEQSPSGSKFVMSPDKESNSPQGSTNSHETEDYTQESGNRDTLQADIAAKLPRLRKLSESTVERLISEPGPQSDASWKHAKQAYRCPLCAKVFPFKSKLQRHVLVHTGIKPYKCTVCGRGFTQQIDLQRHLTRHTGEKPFKCHLCKAQFIRADNLRKHCKDAHYVNIEEPIRKRRRKTTGSDTVLPPLEVAIALALSETERNGGRVLGRATTRSNTKTTSSASGKSRYAIGEPTMSQPPLSRAPDKRHPSAAAAAAASNIYPPRSPRPEVSSPSSYPPNYPPQLGPPRHQQNMQQRYPYHQHQEPSGSSSQSSRTLPPQGYPPSIHHQRGTHSPPSEYRPGSPPYHYSRSSGRGDRRRFIHLNESSSSPHYYEQPPPPRGYYQHRAGYQQQHEDERYLLEKENSRSLATMASSKDPYKDHVSLEHSSSHHHHSSSSTSGYMTTQKRHHTTTEHLARRGEEKDYPPRKEMREEYGVRSSSQEKYRIPPLASKSSPSNQMHSPVEYIQPREREEESYRMDERERSAPRNSVYSSSLPKRENEDHMALFREKPSISYGDYSTAVSSSPGRAPGVETASSSSMVPRGAYLEERTEYVRQHSGATTGGSSDPGELISMVTATPSAEVVEEEDDKDTALIEPRTSSSSTPQPLPPNVFNEDSPVHVYVDDEETPIVTSSDDNMLTTVATPIVTPNNDNMLTTVTTTDATSTLENIDSS